MAINSLARVYRRKLKADEHPSLETRFSRLADRWEEETRFMSSPVQKAQHVTYQQIISMREAAIPLILRRMSEYGGHWFWALSLLADHDPVPPESQGNVAEMKAAWLKWGRANGHC
jgi:hypothetical protein